VASAHQVAKDGRADQHGNLGTSENQPKPDETERDKSAT
jgi:hypothetical protein